MPWKECHVMDDRLRFVARLLEGEKMAPLCGPGDAPPPSPAPGGRPRALARGGAECPLVCRLKGRINVRQGELLLSAHHYRLREPLPADLRGAVDDAGEIRVYGVRADIPSIRAPGRDSDGQLGALCVAACALRAEQTGGVVVAARHSN